MESRPQIRLSSQLRAFTCFVLADCVVGLVEINFLLLAIISVTSENSLMLRELMSLLVCYVPPPSWPGVPLGQVVGVVWLGFL